MFTIGHSLTRNQHGVIIYNGIHHKTSSSGGPTSHGYPDATYLTRTLEELAAKGIVPEDTDVDFAANKVRLLLVMHRLLPHFVVSLSPIFASHPALPPPLLFSRQVGDYTITLSGEDGTSKDPPQDGGGDDDDDGSAPVANEDDGDL